MSKWVEYYIRFDSIVSCILLYIRKFNDGWNFWHVVVFPVVFVCKLKSLVLSTRVQNFNFFRRCKIDEKILICKLKSLAKFEFFSGLRKIDKETQRLFKLKSIVLYIAHIIKKKNFNFSTKLPKKKKIATFLN